MRRTKEEAAATRQQVMEAALKVFSQKGYSATTLEDIAREAGVTRGAIYWHFSNKADLYNTLVEESYARVGQGIEEAVDSGGTVLEMLHRLTVRILSYFEEDQDFRAVNELILFKTTMTPELEAGLRKKREAMRELLDYFVSLIQKGIDAGEIRAELNARDIALALFSFQNGLAVIWFNDPTLFSIRDRAMHMADIFISGISAR